MTTGGIEVMVKIDIQTPVARVTMNRPDVHNAFNDEVIPLITQAFTDLGSRSDIRSIILAGSGKSFCAGADLNWMKRMVNYSRDENIEDARAMFNMFLAIARCPKPVIARVHGSALGGGAGLVAACDIAVAVSSAQFGFTEVKLGILPAVISPFVIARIGSGGAREYFVTGERFSASIAQSIGLIQHVVADESALDALIEAKVAQIMTSAPGAVGEAKKLVFGVDAPTFESAANFTIEATANARAGDEGQAGMKAFLQRQKPPWTPQ
jgi:methylglutaconyl-CoA hydratase